MMHGLLLCVLLLVQPAAGWNVLFVNVLATGSHQTISGYLANLLVENGHTVTYVSTNVPRYLRKEVSVKTLPVCEEYMNSNKPSHGADEKPMTLGDKLGLADGLLRGCERFYEEQSVKEILEKKDKFDLFLTFGAFFDPCALGLANYLGIDNTIVHTPAPALFPILVPMLGLPLYSSSVDLHNILLRDHKAVKTSLTARALNLGKRIFFELVNTAAVKWYIEPVLYNQFPDYPGYTATYQSVKLVLMHSNPHPLMDGPTPFGPGVLTLAGTLCKDYNPEDCSAELNNFMDSATEGLIYFSFGSVQSDVSPEEKAKWVETLSRLPYKVIWKQDKSGDDLPPNILVSSWLPQMSILQHPNTKLFITHGGYASKVEASCAGVPLLVVPRFAMDQYYTASRIESLGLGEKIDDITQVSSDEIYAKIVRIVGKEEETTSYETKMKILKKQLLQIRYTDEQVLGYLDMVIAGHSLLPGYQAWYEYFYLDILAVPVATILVARYVFRKFVRG